MIVQLPKQLFSNLFGTNLKLERAYSWRSLVFVSCLHLQWRLRGLYAVLHNQIVFSQHLANNKNNTTNTHLCRLETIYTLIRKHCTPYMKMKSSIQACNSSHGNKFPMCYPPYTSKIIHVLTSGHTSKIIYEGYFLN